MREHHYSERVHGVRLHWAEIGESDRKPPLVLLHGLNGCYLTWKHLAAQLSSDRRVLALDLPGHGLSERPDATYKIEWYAQMVARWLEALDLRRVDVVGHSFGGGVAQMMLLECPERIRRLVLVSSGGLGREVTVALRLAALPRIVERFGQPFMKAGTKIALKAAGRVLSDRDAAALATMNGQPGSARAFARTVRDVVDWRGQKRTFFQRAHELPELPAVAVFWGELDAVIPVSHARDLSQYVEGVRVVEFKGSGHYPHHQEPYAFEKALRDFLDAGSVPAARVRRTLLDTMPSAQRRSA